MASKPVLHENECDDFELSAILDASGFTAQGVRIDDFGRDIVQHAEDDVFKQYTAKSLAERLLPLPRRVIEQSLNRIRGLSKDARHERRREIVEQTKSEWHGTVHQAKLHGAPHDLFSRPFQNAVNDRDAEAIAQVGRQAEEWLREINRAADRTRLRIERLGLEDA